MDTRRLITAMLAALAVYVLYMYFYGQFLAPPPLPDRPPTDPQTPPAGMPAATQPDEPGATTAPSPAEFAFTSTPGETVRIGGDDFPLALELNPAGAAISTVQLTVRENGTYVHREDAETNEPYTLVRPVTDEFGVYRSFETARIWISAGGATQEWRLDQVDWELVEHSAGRAVFETTLASRIPAEDGSVARRLALTKSYELAADKPLVHMRLEARNLTDEPLTVAFEQNGPTGISEQRVQYDLRFLMAATKPVDDEIEIEKASASQLVGKPEGYPLYQPRTGVSFAWTALTNKYFALTARPIEPAGEEIVRQVLADVAAQGSSETRRGDLRAHMRTAPIALAPGAARGMTFELYAGPKDPHVLAEVDPAFVDRMAVGYSAIRDYDTYCCCSFGWLTDLMIGFMSWIHSFTGNYGVAIIILVIVVRTLLHPLAVFQQKSMYRTQENMARVQPKLAELREKYKNDRARQSQEMMKLYHEEGVNPFAPMVGMIPLFLQMPILIALWNGINTDIHLRHAPFDGWWITDLSSPDAFIRFSEPVSIPLLSMLPFVGFAFRDIPSLNLLPILMGVSMWLQQRYMPKPHIEERLKAAREARAAGKAPETGLGGMTIEDQLRQQQMVANVMAVMFPLLFYYMPSGLTLYWLATNVFGIFESLRIRRQLEREKRRRAELGIQPGKREPGAVARFFKRLAEQAEEIQRQADQVSKGQKPGGKKPPRSDGPDRGKRDDGPPRGPKPKRPKR